MNCAVCNGLLETEADKVLGVHMGFCPGPVSPQNEQLASPEQHVEDAHTVEEAASEEQVESEAEQ